MKIYAAQINPCVGDISGNAEKIISHIKAAAKTKADLIVFPELCITGYLPEDLLSRPSFIQEEQGELKRIAKFVKEIPVVIGATYTDAKDKLHNAAWLLKSGKAQLTSVKADLPNYGVFDEKRYFQTCDIVKTFRAGGKKIGVIVCEDTWSAHKAKQYKKEKVEFLISINASPFHTGKLQERLKIAGARAKEAGLPIAYINMVGGQDGVVFDGGSFILDKNAKLIAMLPQFVEQGGLLEGMAKRLDKNAQRWAAMKLGLRDYLSKSGFKKVLLGLSGGMDSALTAACAVDALGKENVRLVILPTRYSSKMTFDDAYQMCKNLGIQPDLIDIEPAFEATLGMVKKVFAGKKPDLAEENMQSRIRGLVLMAISNKHGELLLTTGNKSEIAVGYSTLYGDSCGAFNLLFDLYKTEVYEIAKWRNSISSLRGDEGDAAIQPGGMDCRAALAITGFPIPENIFKKAPTAELRDNQTDQDSLPPYDVLDAILKLLIEGRKSIKDIIRKGFDAKTVEKTAKLLYQSEFKRWQAAPGVKLSSMAFGKDWRYPLTNKFKK